jgi:F0F1-type ATP synthase membrane subunit b/b'
MSEMMRYHAGNIDKDREVYLASDFDRVTAERDALQALLTATDERNDERDTEISAQVERALRRSFSLGQIYWQQADSDFTYQQNKSNQTMEVQQQHILNVLKSLSAALKPAEGGGDD